MSVGSFSSAVINREIESLQWDEWRIISKNPTSGLSRKDRKKINRDNRKTSCPVGAVAVECIRNSSCTAPPAASAIAKPSPFIPASPLLVPNPNFSPSMCKRTKGADSAQWRSGEPSAQSQASSALQREDSRKGKLSNSRFSHFPSRSANRTDSKNWRKEESSSPSAAMAKKMDSENWKSENFSESNTKVKLTPHFFSFYSGPDANIWGW